MNFLFFSNVIINLVFIAAYYIRRHNSKNLYRCLMPFYEVMRVNQISQKLKPETLVLQIGDNIITGDDVAKAARLYSKIWNDI